MNSQIHKEEFPREKLIKYGPEFLSTYELLAILLNTGSKKENVIELSKRITSQYNINELSQLNIQVLIKELGIGEAKACKIISCFELGKRLKLYEHKDRKQITSAKEVADILIPYMQNLQQEHLITIYLDTRKRIIKQKTQFIGTLSESLISPREIFKNALDENASAIIIAHNHPSGDPTPSIHDIDSTKDLIKAGEFIGIQLLDHIIIGNNKYYSLKENNLIK